MNSQLCLLICIFLIFFLACIKRVNAYASFVKGVKDGWILFNDMYPALLAMMLAVTLLRRSGLLEMSGEFFSQYMPMIPKEIWPMVFFRPISGSASLAILADIFSQCGVDSLVGFMASVIQGSTDTTFYVITLYFSSIKITKIRNALSSGLIADVAGITMAIILSLLFFQ